MKYVLYKKNMKVNTENPIPRGYAMEGAMLRPSGANKIYVVVTAVIKAAGMDVIQWNFF